VGRDVFDKGRFGIESFGHGTLSGEDHFAPFRAEVLRTLADMVFQMPIFRTSYVRVMPQCHATLHLKLYWSMLSGAIRNVPR
jgi:hypothetical protein